VAGAVERNCFKVVRKGGYFVPILGGETSNPMLFFRWAAFGELMRVSQTDMEQEPEEGIAFLFESNSMLFAEIVEFEGRCFRNFADKNKKGGGRGVGRREGGREVGRGRVCIRVGCGSHWA
jgi:hypothetical protein